MIVDDAVVAGSQYRDNGALSVVAGCPAEVTQYAAGVLQQVQWRPDRVFMLDVCESGGSLFVLELNSFSCSGIYACDLPAVIRTTSAVAEDQWNAAAHAQSPS